MENMVTGLSISFIGITIVFAVLAMLAAIISFSSRFFDSKSGGNKDDMTEAKAKPTIVPEQSNVIKASPAQLPSMNYELVAAITAAVAACLHTTVDKLVVKNITRVPSWADTAKKERH